MNERWGTMKFKAIIKEIKQVRKASEDMECSIKLITEDNQIMALSAIPSDVVLDVIIDEERAL